MRILFLNANLAGCGTYHRALWFARLCVRYGGHQATLCTVDPLRRWRRSEAALDGVRVSYGPRWGYRCIPGYGSNWLDIAWRWRELRRGTYDIVYAFEYHPNVAWPVCAGLQPGQVLLSDWCDWYAGGANVMRGNRWLHAWDRRREEGIRHRARRVSVISTPLAERARAIGVDPARITLLREGVDTSVMRPYDRAEAKRALGIPDDALTVGTLNDGHAFPHLVAACAALCAREPRARLLFVGQPAPAQIALIARHGLTDRMIVTGRCSDAALPRHLSAADICALPLADTIAHRARFPHKLGDYLACGAAVAVTNVGDYPALLRAADAACVADSLADFPDALCRLARDHAWRQHLSARGREWVARTLDWAVLAPQILAFIEGRSPVPA